jgi:phosphotransferase system enzyme I (PtsP)
MLVTLRQIMQQVGVAPTLREALDIAVQQVRKAVQVDACAIYLTDVEHDQYIRVASDGLSSHVSGRVSVRAGEGLVGLVGERRELLVETDTKARPGNRLVADPTEESDGSFLGAPLIHYRKLLGVLVAWKPPGHPYAGDEVTFFLSLGAQLAKAVHAAEALDAVGELLGGNPCPDAFIQGVAAASGLGIGQAVLVEAQTRLESIPDRASRDGVAEERAFMAAVAAAKTELHHAGEGLAEALPEAVRALFDVQAMLLGGDDSLVADTVERIRAGSWAPGAWRETIARHALVFEQMDDPYLRERAGDIREVGQHVLMHLQAQMNAARQSPQRCILVGDTIGLAQIAAVPAGCLAGIVTMRGSPLSHTAVLARALGIPAIVSLARMPASRWEGREIVVDGDEGRLYIQPSPALLRTLKGRMREARVRAEQLAALHDLPAQTLDGTRVPLYANIGLPADSAAAAASGAEGIGLYRTEYSFLLGESLPVEEEQFQAYREVLAFFAPMPVTLRTLDVGADKALSSFPLQEDNPFLGCRGIRFSLDHPELFLMHLRAMLRANAGLNNLQVLFPMIGTVAELNEALGLLARAHRELAAEGLDAARPRVGVMIEVPASVYLTGAFARRVDFFSIGTNDLTQYMLAVDRNNAQVVTPYDGLHPAVLDAIRRVVGTAHRHRRPVSVCGELAGDPAGALLLLGMGVDSLSMSPALLPAVKRTIRCFSLERARLLANAALGMEDGFAIHRLVNGALEEIRDCPGASGTVSTTAVAPTGSPVPR